MLRPKTGDLVTTGFDRHGRPSKQLVRIEDPLRVVLGFLETWRFRHQQSYSRPTWFDESSLRLANRGGARISAAEIATMLSGAAQSSEPYGGIASNASLAARQNTVPWPTLSTALRHIRGHPRGALLEDDESAPPEAPLVADPHARRGPIQAYLQDDDLGTPSFIQENTPPALLRGYKQDLDHNSAAVQASCRQEISGSGSA